METLTLQNFIDLLYARKGTTIFVIETETVPDMIKTGNCLVGRTVKRSKVSVQVGFDWDNAVNNALEKQGEARDFVSGQRQWGEVDEKRAFIVNKDQLYLRARVLKSLDTQYYFDGQPIDASLVKPWLRPRPQTPEVAITRNWKMSNVKAVHIGGKEYTLQFGSFVLPNQLATV